MKKPKISFNKDAILDFLLRNVEKILAAVIGLFACTLAWGGVDALRSMRPTAEQTPQTIKEQAKVTADHIVSVKIPPEDRLVKERGLANVVSKWLAPKIVPSPTKTIFNKPLFAEVARRTKPEILPIENLQAVAAVTIIAIRPPAAAGRAAERPAEPEPAAAPKPKPGRGPRAAGNQPAPGMPGGMSIDTAMGGFPGMAPGMMPGMPGMMPGMPGAPGMVPGMPGMPGAAAAKIVPYVLVTGLVPYAKQYEEFDRCFLQASLHDAVIDTPRWTKYVIEKAEVMPGVPEKWVEVNLKNVIRQFSAEWAAFQPEPSLAPFLLPDQQNLIENRKEQLPFATPLPQRADGVWGLDALHPWFVDHLREQMEKKRKEEDKLRRDAEPDVFGAGGNAGIAGMPATSPDMFAAGSVPGSATDPAMMGSGMMPGMPGAGMMPGMSGSGMMPGMAGGPQQVDLGVKYRLFRFIDLGVQPGRSYRYRVRVAARNPNYNLPNRHLADPSLAKQQTLESSPSAASEPVLVPDGRQLLVQPVKKADQKRIKPPQVPVYVLGELPKSPSLALRSLTMEPGGLANVDPRQNKKGNPTSQGEEIATERVLVDVRGKIDDRAETRGAGGKQTPPPEPLEMIFLRPDGTFEVASVPDSQSQLERYRGTLPREGGDAAGAPGGQQPGGPFMQIPFGGAAGAAPGGVGR
jgi:hypothetical protein